MKITLIFFNLCIASLFICNAQEKTFNKKYEPIYVKGGIVSFGLSNSNELSYIKSISPSDPNSEEYNTYSLEKIENGKRIQLKTLNKNILWSYKSFFGENTGIVFGYQYHNITNKVPDKNGRYEKYSSLEIQSYSYSGVSKSIKQLKETNRDCYLIDVINTSDNGYLAIGQILSYKGKKSDALSLSKGYRVTAKGPGAEWLEKAEILLIKYDTNGEIEFFKRHEHLGAVLFKSINNYTINNRAIFIQYGKSVLTYDLKGEFVNKTSLEGSWSDFTKKMKKHISEYRFEAITQKNKNHKKTGKPKMEGIIKSFKIDRDNQLAEISLSTSPARTSMILDYTQFDDNIVVAYKTSQKKSSDEVKVSFYNSELKPLQEYLFFSKLDGTFKEKNTSVSTFDNLVTFRGGKILTIYNSEMNSMFKYVSPKKRISSVRILIKNDQLLFFDDSKLHHYQLE
ncbi:hypothetical protein [uncultured Algibacter sp.]|uniref:hypothetical protein n=1 Tax=uncultured Algibacter sp. TaxID=298659 RepID=UPI002631B3A1|nr:hypothetical protein [uncultured Algibacter sp.]